MKFDEAFDTLYNGKCRRIRRKRWDKEFYLWKDYDNSIRWSIKNKYKRFDSGNYVFDFLDFIGNDWEIISELDNTDQTIKSDAGKPRLSLVPTEIINCIARVREYGVKKYPSVDSWKQVSTERYHDALFRHVIAYINDPKSIDEESGLPHLWHLATNIAFLCELEKK